MPKLLALIACEKVIVERSGSMSAISMLDHIYLPIVGAPPLENTVIGYRWAVLAIWQKTPGERDINYTPQIKITGPDGNNFGNPATKVLVKGGDDLKHKVYMELTTLHVGREGSVKVLVWLEEDRAASGEYEFFIKHVWPAAKN